jgi:hypothetical protein
MDQDFSFRWLLVPLLILSILALALYVERTGLTYDVRRSSLQFLDPLDEPSFPDLPGTPAECLVLYDSKGIEGMEHYTNVIDTLNSMRVKYNALDVDNTTEFNLEVYQTAVIAFIDLEKIKSQILELADWVQNGGRVLFSIRPDPSQSFSAIYRKMGILSKNDEFVMVKGVEFISDLFPGANGISIGMDFFVHNSIPIQLEDDCRVHLISADEYALPLLWEYDYGQGRFVVINSDQFNNKSSRGTIGAAYSLLQDVFVYPVINSSLFFIDDFPSPIPEGEYELISKEFGRDIQSFYINIWWPDMQSYSRRYGLKYTGVIIETYNNNLTPPFDSQSAIDTFQYMGSSLLEGGGEIGLHGYNHVPLCLEDTGYNQQLDYPAWTSTESMQMAVNELYEFGYSLFPDQPFNTYVPPSNILCPQTRTWLPEVLPDLRVIASVYLQDPTVPEYIQEFTEAADGIIELPRIVAGFAPSEYMHWASMNEVVLHYIHSHFVHPDDVLDEERNLGHGWTYLRDKLDEYLLWLYASAPSIRNMTAREGAMAVQRFDRLELNTEFNRGSYSIHLDNFYDEAWLMMRSSRKPVIIDGGTITKVTSDLYLIEAIKSNIEIEFEE